MNRVVIVSASVGAGHDGAARELARRLTDHGHTVDIHDYLDMLPGSAGRTLGAAYLRQLQAAPRTWDILLRALQLSRPFAALVCLLFAIAGRRMLHAVRSADLIVSTHPMPSQTLSRLKAKGRVTAPVVTYLTDMSVHRLWVAPNVDLHIALHGVAAEQARRLGARRIAVTGPAVGPAFRPVMNAAERRLARAKFGLPFEGRLALVVAGSWGVGDIADTARDIARIGLATPVVLCGQNETVRRRLADSGEGIALGWIDDMPTLMRACDVVVQNAGGLSSLEALATGLPVITYRCLAGHGRTNAAALDDAGLVPWIRDRDGLTAALTAEPVRAPLSTLCPTVALDGEMTHRETVPVTRSRRRRRLAIVAASTVAFLWLATVGVSLAVAGGFQSVGPASRRGGSVYVLVAMDSTKPMSRSTIEKLAAVHGAAAVSTKALRAQPATVRDLAKAGVTIVNAADGAPYETGVFTGRASIGQVAAGVAAVTGRSPRLMVSNGELDAIDVGIVAMHRERIIVPAATVHCGAAMGHGMKGVILVESTGDCDLEATLDALSAMASRHSVRQASIEELAA
ncbi:MGDG synthase family glycosyltransferase [Kutzneria sp. CA-103260]|uniref:MGDG synthase family glycosyltransferase n=1 Tax=Kutzneria sp. CA-103260 TaxID=2802641 RepID=UPI001BAA915E|nr:glycosyltransferase [Kutzneria sp. CA-103260]QUQ70358.1 Processive diacylglycerol beta-glucosyltransferase [Kutzneria sp. CA-103260]